jgi:hypothetical protein
MKLRAPDDDMSCKGRRLREDDPMSANCFTAGFEALE